MPFRLTQNDNHFRPVPVGARLLLGGLLLALLVLLPNAGLASALTCDRTLIDREIPAGTPELRIEIPLRNTGARPVTITDLRSSCGCTTLLLPDKTIPAGAKTTLTAVYKPGDRTGPQQSEITLKTDEPDSLRLTLRINLTPLLTIHPALVRWSQGEVPTAKTITLQAIASIQVLSAEPTQPDVAVELKPGADSGTWLLQVTPHSTSAILTTKILIHTQVGEHPVTYAAFAVVR